MRPSSTLLCLSYLLVVLPTAGSAAVLVGIHDLSPGDVKIQGFVLDRAQSVKITAVGLERRQPFGSLSSAWILDAESRQVIWTMGQESQGLRRRVFRDFEETLRLDAGSYEVYYATFPAWDELEERDGWWEAATEAVARLLGQGGYADAIEELSITVDGAGRRLSEEALEGIREQQRDRALLSLPGLENDLAQNRGFILNRPVEVELYAAGELSPEEGYDYGWIIDAKTRRKVWSFSFAGSQPGGGARKNRLVRQTLRLPAGRYAAFFVTDDSHSPAGWNSLPPYDPAFWGLTLWLKDPSNKRYTKTFDYRHLPGKQVIVELTRLQDDEYRSRGISVTAPTEVRIYAVGEGIKTGMTDYGWIVNGQTHERVWSMTYERTAHAGGSQKNRAVDEILHLEPGSYVIAFITDDSHAYGEWNAKPPTHPDRWGVSLFATDNTDPSRLTPHPKSDNLAVLARIAQVTSQRHERQPFSLDQRAQVYLYALGEGIDGKMYDYGWIEETGTGRVVWKMTYETTDRAGGAAKNRAYHGVLSLDPGGYTLHYKSDDSHAFEDWNANPPHDPGGWGIQLALVALEP